MFQPVMRIGGSKPLKILRLILSTAFPGPPVPAPQTTSDLTSDLLQVFDLPWVPSSRTSHSSAMNCESIRARRLPAFRRSEMIRRSCPGTNGYARVQPLIRAKKKRRCPRRLLENDPFPALLSDARWLPGAAGRVGVQLCPESDLMTDLKLD